MFIWDLLTACTDVMEGVFSFLTGVVSLLATIATLNERLLLFVIDFLRTATDEVYNVGELLDKFITCRLSQEDFDHYGLKTILETRNNIYDLIFYWFCVFQQFLTPLPIGVSLAVAVAIFSAIHRRKWVPYMKYFLPHRWRNRHTGDFIVRETNDDSEDDWNANEHLVLDYDDVRDLRAEISNGESSDSDDEDVHSTFTEETTGHQSDSDSDAERYSPFHNRDSKARCRSSRNSNIDKSHRSLQSQEDKLLCVICQDKNKSVVVLPCRHLCMCLACAEVISCNAELPKICPLCRTVISRLINVYV